MARPIRKVRVKGRKREFMIYELLGITTSDDPELKAPDDAVRLCDLTREASIYFERGELDQAARRYEDILRAFPDDPVARRHFRRVRKGCSLVDLLRRHGSSQATLHIAIMRKLPVVLLCRTVSVLPKHPHQRHFPPSRLDTRDVSADRHDT